ncbi:hypothetical protein [Nonomuraea jabiensis]|uniref:hypothetical protein n=1 Tax=Nonomuraea jabiensis TaxID=882448 RepID=UPI0036936073
MPGQAVQGTYGGQGLLDAGRSPFGGAQPAVYPAGVCPVAGKARRPRSARQAVKVAHWRA